MCGIYGELAVFPIPDARRAFADSAERALRHRGPDGAGRWSDAHCLLGHTRLAVLDPTDEAAQPMASSSGRSRVVFNGEIYNYVELREGRVRAPSPGGWRSSGDTEVLVEALDHDGIGALASMIGMFAIAHYRPEPRELLLVRDRLGKKPLYYARTSRGLRFASEVGALLADGSIPRATTPDRLAEYLQHGYVASPRTGFVAISAVPPGGFLRARIVGDAVVVETGRWWGIPASAAIDSDRHRGRDLHDDPLDPGEAAAGAWREEFDALLADAVRIRLRSDVPLGAFLSGGVDSSVVSLLASRSLGGALRTYTVDFDEAGYSEGPYAAEVARHIGANHTELRITPESALSIAELVSTYGDLHGDSSALPTMALCAATRRHVTVALSGDGGDELLGGYSRYARTLRLAAIAARVPSPVAAAVRYVARETIPWWLRGASLLGRVSPRAGEVYERELWGWAPHRWPNVLRHPARLLGAGGFGTTDWPDAVARALHEHRHRAPLQRLMACDLETYLPEDILVKVDRASMAVGLEVRAPLLDHRLIEHSMRAHPSWVARKAPLRALYASSLPSSVFTRRKAGFAVPLGAWFRGDLASFASDRLLDRGSRIAPLIDERVMRRVLTNRTRDESGHIWQLLVMAAWFDAWRPSIETGREPTGGSMREPLRAPFRPARHDDKEGVSSDDKEGVGTDDKEGVTAIEGVALAEGTGAGGAT